MCDSHKICGLKSGPINALFYLALLGACTETGLFKPFTLSGLRKILSQVTVVAWVTKTAVFPREKTPKLDRTGRIVKFF